MSKSESNRNPESVYVQFEQALADLPCDPAAETKLLKSFWNHPDLETTPGHPESSLRELVLILFHRRNERNWPVPIHDYEQHFPEKLEVVRKAFEEFQSRIQSRQMRTPANDTLPGLLRGQFEPLQRLGSGAFGAVFLCWDKKLKRNVAIKIPRLSVAALASVQQEAESLAQFAQVGIPAIYETFVETVNGQPSLCLVFQYIEGQTLSQALRPRSTPPDFDRIAEILARTAGVLQSMHSKRIWHWDLKPSNIMIDSTGQVWIVDFGLSVFERDRIDHEGRQLGTLSYMSPEQAAGEPNRDGRSDIWSLGVVLYELLTGQLPFAGDTDDKILYAIRNLQPALPRSSRPEIPPELQRICLKCLQKHPDERYHAAADLQRDLESWKEPAPQPAATLKTPATPAPDGTPGVRFRGLRSYTAEDADFFLKLLPGIPGKNGLPPSVDFWKQRLDNRTDRENSIPVGILTGESGCGKSSLMKAAVIPLLDADIKTCLLEPAAEQLESRLRQKLVSSYSDLANLSSLAGQLESIRDRHQQRGTKFLLVIDQFEQWLHAKDETEWTDLANALRQCDGLHLQTVLIVRSDFRGAIISFFHLLGQSVNERTHNPKPDTNCRTVELFSPGHARRVLHMFGVQLQRLPEEIEPGSAADQFLGGVVKELSAGGKVITVRLAVFVQMFADRDWTPDSLDEVGGARGIGVAFLEQSLSAAGASITIRRHQQAAQHLLRAMLPAAGTEVRGYPVAEKQLKITAGYQQREADFQQLLSLLDEELRMITPVDSLTADEQPQQGTGVQSCAFAAEKHYVLTHDFLVPSLREWLSGKLKETPEGQAQLLLEERTAQWSVSQDSRQLPSLVEYLWICWYFKGRKRKDAWTKTQRAMMARAGRRHAIRSGLVLALLCVMTLAGQMVQSRVTADWARDLAATIADRKTSALASGVELLVPSKRHALPELQRLYTDTEDGSEAQLHLGIARLMLGDADERLLPVVLQLALQCRPEQLLPLVRLLQPWSAELSPELKPLLRNGGEKAGKRLHAACLLAGWENADQPDAAWGDAATAEFVAAELVKTGPVFVGYYQEVLRAQSDRLTVPLATLFSDAQQGEVSRTIIASLLADYDKTDAAILTRVLLDADPATDKILFPRLMPLRDKAIRQLHAVLDRKLTPGWADQPLNKKWREPDADVKAEIEAHSGLITEQFAFCPDISLSQLLSLVETLRISGYRPTRLRPHAGQSGDDPRMSAVWVRDSGQWAVQTAVKAETLPGPQANAERDGLLLADLVLIPGDGPQSGWLTLWNSPVAGDEQRRCVFDLSREDLESWQKQLTEQSFSSQLSLQAYATNEQKRHFAAVFSNLGASSDTLLTWAGFERIDSPQRDLTVGPIVPLEMPDPLAGYRSQLKSMLDLSAEQLQRPQARFDRAEALFQTGQLELAVADLSWLHENLAEPDELVLQFRTLALAQLQRHEEATVSFDAYRQTGPAQSNLDYVAIQLAAWRKDVSGVHSTLDAAAKSHQQNGSDLYNIACAAALAGRAFRQQDALAEAEMFQTRALQLLEQSVQSGYADGENLQKDPDFKDLHQDPRFGAVMQELIPSGPFAGVWHLDPTVETCLVRAESSDALLRKLQLLLAEQWRPLSIAVLSGVDSPQSLMLLQRPLIAKADQETLALRQAAAAVALLRLNAAERVWPLLQDSPDPSVRSHILHRLPRYGIDALTLQTQLGTEADSGRRRALIQGLGELAASGLIAETQKTALIDDLLGRFSNDPDPGVHGMCEWTLRQLGAEQQLVPIQQQFAKGAAIGDRRWYLTKTGSSADGTPISMAIVDARQDFRMGSPLSESGRDDDELQHLRRINRVLAIGMHETTVEQFRHFRPEHPFKRQYATTSDAPANVITWYDAAAFCNWLSQQEGIPADQWCYEPDQPFANGMRIRPNYPELSGYRLPTEPEWEFACRCGTKTARFFGDLDSLVHQYGWFTGNSGDNKLSPVGSLRPNGHGLFGCYGNVSEWCQDFPIRYLKDRALAADSEQSGFLEVVNSQSRALRGGSFFAYAKLMRSAYRSLNRPDTQNIDIGFRVARTYSLRP